MDGNSNFIVNSYNSNSNFSLAEENGHPQNIIQGRNSQESFGNGYKRTVFDAIHGHLEFDKYVWEFIDTVEFQRLRNLKQLGNCHFVFPGANHSRFEHSIGTAYLSNRLINHLIQGIREKTCVFNLNNSCRINEDFNVQAVTLAGLLHDLGHGPFSHLFDRKVIKFLDPSITWEHENGSSMLLEYLIDNNHIDIEPEQRKLVQSLILGEIKPSTSSEFYYDSWIYQIVANKKNSIDVDKFDYLCRDAYNVGLQSSHVDYERIFSTAKIIDNNLCFNIKNDYNLLKLFQNRYRLFKQVYMHRKSIAIDQKIKDILILSNKHFNFTEVIFDPEEYLKLDDGILNIIEDFSSDPDNDPDLLKASKMVTELRHRNFYRYVGEILIPMNSKEIMKKITLEEISSYNNAKDQNYVRPEDLDMVSYSIDYGNGERNPFDTIHFYKQEAPDKSFVIPSNKVSMSVPKVFKESYLFVYCKDENKIHRAKECFQAFMKKLKMDIEISKKERELEINYSTPVKNNRSGDRFINSKRERELSSGHNSITNLNLNVQFNKIN